MKRNLLLAGFVLLIGCSGAEPAEPVEEPGRILVEISELGSPTGTSPIEDHAEHPHHQALCEQETEPIYKGDVKYLEEMDHDNDGKTCE